MEQLLALLDKVPVILQGTIATAVLSGLISLVAAKFVNKKKWKAAATKLSTLNGGVINFILPTWLGKKNAQKLENGILDTAIEFAIEYFTNLRKVILGDNKKK